MWAAVRCYRHFMLGSSQHSGSKTWSEVFLKKEALDGRRWPGHAQKLKNHEIMIGSRCRAPDRRAGGQTGRQAGGRAGGAERESERESERERGSDDDSRVVDGRFHHGRELEGRVLHVPTLLGGKVPDLWD